MPLSLRRYTPELREAWDAFVTRHPHGSPFHLIAWKQSVKTLSVTLPITSPRWTPRALVQAVLPLFLVENLLIGKALIFDAVRRVWRGLERFAGSP